MRFDINVKDTEVISLVSRFIAITGEGPWVRKFRVLQQQGIENPFLKQWQLERAGIEMKLGHLLARQESEGRFPILPEDERHYDLYGFAAGIVRIHERLSPAAQRRLRGMLLDGLKPDNNLLSLQHEITTAVHLVLRGYEIECNDLERGSGVDFIASRDGIEVEVECRMFTGDLGRQLHRRKVLMLHKHVSETVARAFQSATRGLFVRVTLPSRLTCSPAQLAGIGQALSAGLLAGNQTTKTPDCEIEVVDFAIENSPFNVSSPKDIDRATLDRFAQGKFARPNKEMMVFFSPKKRAVVALVESAKPDEVLKGVARQLRDKAEQFTKTRPGVISVQFQDLTADQLENIADQDSHSPAGPNGLQILTHDFFDSEKRAHVHTVVYRSQSRIIAEGNTITGGGPAYFFRNRHHTHYADERCGLFGG